MVFPHYLTLLLWYLDCSCQLTLCRHILSDFECLVAIIVVEVVCSVYAITVGPTAPSLESEHAECLHVL